MQNRHRIKANQWKKTQKGVKEPKMREKGKKMDEIQWNDQLLCDFAWNERKTHQMQGLHWSGKVTIHRSTSNQQWSYHNHHSDLHKQWSCLRWYLKGRLSIDVRSASNANVVESNHCNHHSNGHCDDTVVAEEEGWISWRQWIAEDGCERIVELQLSRGLQGY